jgi:hypothetical protein
VPPTSDRVTDGPEYGEDQADDDAEHADAAEDAVLRLQGSDNEQEDAETDHEGCRPIVVSVGKTIERLAG